MEKKRGLRADLVAYVLINMFLVVIGAMSGFGYFWPGWVMAGGGVLLALDVYHVYTGRPVTEAHIERELRAKR